MTAFGTSILTSGGAVGLLDLEAWPGDTEPAPQADTSGPEFSVLSGSIRSTYDTHRGLEDGDHVFVTPYLPSGNTGV